MGAVQATDLLIVLLRFVLVYYSSVALQASTTDHTMMSANGLTEYVFTEDATSVVDAKDRACSTYHTGRFRVDHMSSALFLSSYHD